MKITFNSFDCPNGSSSQKMVLVHFDNYLDFISKFNLDLCEFMPDYITHKMNSFLFFYDGDAWDTFTTNAILYSDYEICTKHSETTFHVNFELCTPCNQHMLDYLAYPERRNEIFLYESRNHEAVKSFCDTLYTGLTDPKNSGVKSLDSFKNFWQKSLGTARYAHFPTRYNSFLTSFSFRFPKLYNWIYLNYINDSLFFSSRFHNDFISHCNFDINGPELPF